MREVLLNIGCIVLGNNQHWEAISMREVLFNTECIAIRSDHPGGWSRKGACESPIPPPGLGCNQGWGFRADINTPLLCLKDTRGDHAPLRFIITCDKTLLPYIICHR